MRKLKLSWKINLVISGFLISFITDGIFYSFGVFLPHLVEEFKRDRGETAWVGSLSRGHIQLIGLVVGPLTKHFGCTAVAIVGSLIASLALFLSAFAVNLLYLDFSYGVLGGCAAGFCIHPAVIATTVNFNAHRGLAVGLVTAGTGCGNFAFAIIMSQLLDGQKLKWQSCFAICGAFILFVAILALFLRPFNPCPCCCKLVRPLIESTVDERVETENKSRETLTSKQSGRKRICIFCKEIFFFFCNYRLLTHSRFILMCLGGALVSLGLFVPPMFICDYAGSAGYDRQESALLLSIMGFTNMGSRVVLGFLTDQSWTNVLAVFIIGTFIGGAVTIPLGYVKPYGLLITYSSIFGVSMGCVLSLRSTAVHELMGKELFHEAFGIYLLFTGICAFIGPPLFGYILEETDYIITFISSGIVILVGFILLFLIPAGVIINKLININRREPIEQQLDALSSPIT